MALTEASALVAILDADDPYHAACVAAAERLPAGPLLTTRVCFTEAMYLLGTVGGYRYQVALWSLRATGRLMLHDLTPAEADRMAALMAQYQDTPMDLADASFLHALVTILLRIAVQQPVLFVMEDLHWVDPSTLELLSLLVDQGPTARILALLTCRPDFSPPWTGRAHLTQVTVTRLPRSQAMEVIHQVARGKVLPPEVIEQIVAKTDGVPLFVEELTKMVLESGLLQEREDRYELTGPLPPLAIPATLHDSLMARLDRLATVKSLAQLGATLGRAFSYALLHAVTPWDEETLRRGLHQLVEAEFLYQQGLPPHATYLFKHALIQDAAYQSLLRSTRQQHHQRIAQALEAQFPEIVETHAAAGQAEAGLNVLAEALALVDHTGERYWEAELYRLKGELLLRQTVPDTPRAEACFQQALTIARRQQAKSWELRTAMSLGRLWLQQGKQAKAQALLAPIYAWFTEGLETADLQEAKALLDGLQG